MRPRLEDMACINDAGVRKRLAAPAAANLERGEARRHLDERHRFHEAALSALIQDGVAEHESMCANVGADVDASGGRRRLHQSVPDTKATSPRLGAAEWHRSGSVTPDTSRRVVPHCRCRVVGGYVSWDRLINDLPRGDVERDALCGCRRNETAGQTRDEA